MRWHWRESVRELGLRDICSHVKFQGSASLLGGGVGDKQQSGRSRPNWLFDPPFQLSYHTVVITAPVKPSKQTQILLDNMSKSTDEKQSMDQVMEHFDLLFTRVNDIGETQQQMKQQMDIRGAEMDEYTAEQHLIAQIGQG